MTSGARAWPFVVLFLGCAASTPVETQGTRGAHGSDPEMRVSAPSSVISAAATAPKPGTSPAPVAVFAAPVLSAKRATLGTTGKFSLKVDGKAAPPLKAIITARDDDRALRLLLSSAPQHSCESYMDDAAAWLEVPLAPGPRGNFFAGEAVRVDSSLESADLNVRLRGSSVEVVLSELDPATNRSKLELAIDFAGPDSNLKPTSVRGGGTVEATLCKDPDVDRVLSQAAILQQHPLTVTDGSRRAVVDGAPFKPESAIATLIPGKDGAADFAFLTLYEAKATCGSRPLGRALELEPSLTSKTVLRSGPQPVRISAITERTGSRISEHNHPLDNPMAYLTLSATSFEAEGHMRGEFVVDTFDPSTNRGIVAALRFDALVCDMR